MSSDLGLFLEACGANGPLRLEWDDWETGRPVARDFERPAILVGRNPHADLVLGHPLVGLRHAYLQLVEGRLFATDLGSREGLHWGGVPRRGGWIDRGRPVQVGVTTIRVVEGDRAGDWGPGPGPTSRRYKSSRSLPRAVLEMLGSGEEMRRLPLDRVLTLVGGSQHCHVRLPGPGTSRFVCGLLRTSVGVWAVDLLSSQGVAVNGAICRQVRLEDGDVLRIGALAVRLTYGEFTAPPRADSPTQLAGPISGLGPDWSSVGPLPPALIDGPGTLLLEAALRPLLEGEGPSPDVASSPFGQALILLIRLLGDIHRDHLKLVREELAQIRRINLEMKVKATGAGLASPDPGTGTKAATVEDAAANGDPEPGPGVPHPRLVDPEAVHSLVGERLVAWEQERRSRWQRVIELLVKR